MRTPPLFCSLGAAVCLAGAWSGAAHAAIRYSVVDLGPVLSTGDTGKDINALGVAAFTQSTGVRLYHNGVTTVLTGVAAGNGPLAINNLSHLAGANSHRSYLYANGVKTDLGSLDPVWNDDIYALGLNDLDTVVGVSRIVSENAWRAFRWKDGAISQLPPPVGHEYAVAVHSSARAINNAGTIIGSYGSYVPDGENAVMWREGIASILPMPEGYEYAYASDLNELDQATGYVRNSARYTRAAVWTANSVELLGLVDSWPSAQATGMNDLGQVVGFAGSVGYDNGLGVLWENGEGILLNSLIDPEAGWTVWNPSAINNSGMIVGWGQHTLSSGITEVRSVLLVPVPEPSGLAIILATALVLRRVRRPWPA